MNRRRKVGSTLLLSSLAALSIVGMGLAAAVLPATTSAEFGFEWTEEQDTSIGTVTASDMTNVKLVVNEASKKATLKNPIQFTFTPDESLVDHTFELAYTFTMPESFDTYFTLTAGADGGTVQADTPAGRAAGDVVFSIPTTALAADLIGDFEETKTTFAEANITVNVTVTDVTGKEDEGGGEIEEPVETTTAVADFSNGWDGFTFAGSVFSKPLENQNEETQTYLNSTGDTIAASVENVTKIYTDSNVEGLKFGSADVDGKLSFTAPKAVSKISIKAVAWKGKTPSITINESSNTFDAEGTGSIDAAQTFEVDFETPTDKIDISGDERFAVVGITLTFAA